MDELQAKLNDLREREKRVGLRILKDGSGSGADARYRIFDVNEAAQPRWTGLTLEEVEGIVSAMEQQKGV